MAGNDPSTDGGVGVWTTFSGTGVATTPTSPTSGVTALTVGAATTFRWTVTKGGCQTTFDDIVITVSSPVTSNAGTAQTICNATTATLAGSNPTPGTGLWTRTAGTGAITSPTVSNSGVTGLTVGAASTFLWTVTNGACTANSSVTITVSAPVTSNSGPDQTICNTTTTILAATTPSLGSGLWTRTGGTGTVTTPTSPTSGVTGLTVGASSAFQWTVSNGACSANTTVTITVSAPVTSNAGSAQDICNITTATLAGSNPTPGTGLWTRTAGTGSITSPTVSNSGVTGLTVGASSTFLWTVTNGACSANSSVIITVSAAVTSNSGSYQTICNTTTTTLAAIAPSLGSGLWTRTGGTGTLTTPTSPTSGVTGLTVGASSAFQWTVTNGSCSANTTVTITVSAPVTSNAGTSQTLCNVTTATLGATVPSPGSGAWSTTSGTGVATTASSETSGVTGLTIGSSSTFLWTVTNGACSIGSSVTITVSSPIVQINSSQNICNTTVATLSASGTGTWAKTSGSGVVTTPSSSSSGVTNLTIGAASVFEWTTTVGGCTGVQEVTTINVSSPATANAGSDIGLCAATSTNLGATGTGTWTKISGTGTVTTPSSPTSSVTGLTIGATSVFQWSVTNGACSANASINVVSTTEPIMNVGADFATCLNTFALAALNPGAGYTGTWTAAAGIVFTPPNDPKAVISGLATGLNTLTWTVTGTGNCTGNYTATLNITYGVSDLTVKLKAPDDTACVTSARTLVAKAEGGSGNYKYVWYSNLDFNNPVINNATIIDTTLMPTYNVLPKSDKNLYWLVVYDRNNVGCSTPFSADTLFASIGQDLNVPNLITPNEDDRNDYWVLKDKITKQEILPGSKFDLYNRWGERIFTMDSYDNRFNAPHISDGVYYYYVKSGCGDKEYKGWLQILGNNNP